jgi:hypothetical protein
LKNISIADSLWAALGRGLEGRGRRRRLIGESGARGARADSLRYVTPAIANGERE